jgi:thioredoxin-like negative regulator of GroEL
MIERLALFGILLVGLVLLWVAVVAGARFRRWRRVDRMRNPELSQGKTTVLFFTGEHCSVCHYRQKPALDVVRSSHNGDLRVVELDAAEENSLARRFGVLSLPSTVVLAADGTVGAVNYGFAPSDQLNAQVASVA